MDSAANERGPLDGILGWIEKHAGDPAAARDPSTAPIDVAEVRVPAQVWTSWQRDADSAARVGRKRANALGVILVIVLAVPGLALLPWASKMSTIVYAPALAFAARSIAQHRVRQYLFASTARAMRPAAMPTLLHDPSDAELFSLALHGGVVVVNEQKIVAAQPTNDNDYLVVAARYDLTQFPTFSGPFGGGNVAGPC